MKKRETRTTVPQKDGSSGGISDKKSLEKSLQDKTSPGKSYSEKKSPENRKKRVRASPQFGVKSNRN